MPSPFPGMNPYLEQEDVWHDFHERFLPAAAEVLGAQLVPDYIVKIDEHVYIHELPSGPRQFLGWADLFVGPSGHAGGDRPGPGVLEAPAQVELPGVVVERVAFIAIRDRRDRELVVMIELLSPSNKRSGPDRDQYLAKRGRLLASPVHLVEIDLLRGGAPMPMDDRPPCSYSVLVSRAERRPRGDFWPIGLREPLPVIPIPVRAVGSGARLDLQALVHRIHDAAGYQYYVYDGHPGPVLSPDDAAWAVGMIEGRGAGGPFPPADSP